MKLLFLILFHIVFCFGCRAQVFDDFSDGDFSENPNWLGNDSLFIINDEKQLQLNATETGNAFLSVNYTKADEMEWRFWIREKFSPSSKNFCDVYLICDNWKLKESSHSYILRFGESGSEDVIELLHGDHGELNSICRGNDTFIASSFSTFIKVTLDNTNTWKIYIDKNGEGAFKLEAEATTDNILTPNDSTYFGFDCNYTNSNVRQFYFDDIYIGEKTIDSTAPYLTNCETIDDNQLELKFSETITEQSALNTKNYLIENKGINPLQASFGNAHSTIILEFEDAFEEETYHTLIVENIEDSEGNISEKIVHDFLYYNAKEYDLVINEIMADPSPPIELPEYEYIELYNISNFPIDIKRWKLMIGNTEYTVEQDFKIQPKEYFLFCHDDAIEELSDYGKCYGFSSFQISNSGTQIKLFDANESLITSVDFNIAWHSSNHKKEGGWSMEQIDYDHPCAGKPNWSSTICGAGGTPGKTNSIHNINIISPRLDHINPDTDNSIEVFFNQNMDITSLQDSSNYFIKEMQINPSEIIITPNDSDYVRLVFKQNFEERRLYTLNIDNVFNCKGITLEDEINTTFGIPTTADSNDIVINEILFNPISPGVDYLEIYNRSEKVIDMSKLLLGTIKESFPNPSDTITKEISTESRILLPHSYILLSSDSYIVKKQYLTNENEREYDFLELSSFPSFPNEEGHIIVCNRSLEIIDEAFYSDKMHYDLLTETKGVALERIAADNSSLDRNNWHSASFNVNYGTPGYKNSMTVDTININNENEINIIPEIFSPDGDGFDDNCAIYYKLKENGFSMNIKIFNSRGILTRNLLDNNLVDAEGFITWDGCDDNNHSLEPGIYIVQAEIFDLKGFLKRIRKCVVIATKKSP